MAIVTRQTPAPTGLCTVMLEGGPGGLLSPPPQHLADQLTLFHPGREDYPHLCFSPSGITGVGTGH